MKGLGHVLVTITRLFLLLVFSSSPTSDDVDLSVEGRRHVIGPWAEHGRHGNPAALARHVLPGLRGGPGVGVGPPRPACQSHSSTSTYSLLFILFIVTTSSERRWQNTSFILRKHV